MEEEPAQTWGGVQSRTLGDVLLELDMYAQQLAYEEAFELKRGSELNIMGGG
eukprot:CAMPEP_0118933162 /NCGR_PEP_ID=MMETSP1169-20130426/11473_1 /TAXON_ID=36882 /ORGANISM="Pyramimonas obovata, Strain CCMP722" /LENGTH=51 /DNA_ID=CAMNT_0006875895 /DNA_START=194 /DNA_END=345 /DNA_ORIENTATION=-